MDRKGYQLGSNIDELRYGDRSRVRRGWWSRRGVCLMAFSCGGGDAFSDVGVGF